MKIVHHSNQLGMGGTEKCLQYFLEYLRAAGHDCYCMHNREKTAAAGGYRGRLISGLLGPEKVLSYSTEKEFFEKLSAVRPDIFHIHRSGGAGEFPVVPALKEFIAKVVETNVFGGVDPSDVIDMTLYVNKYLLKTGRGLNRAKHVLYNPVKKPLHALDLREKLGIGREVFVLGRIGRPDDYGFDPIALKALKLIESGPARNILYLVQSPPPQMIKMAEELGLKNIRFLETPIVEDSALSGFYNTIDVLAHARRDGETFGLNIAEAMMHGKPVISHRSRIANGHEEFVRKCGYFSGVDDYKGYADFIVRLYSDRELAGRLGSAGRVFAENNFLFEKIGESLERYYAELWQPRRSWLRAIWDGN